MKTEAAEAKYIVPMDKLENPRGIANILKAVVASGYKKNDIIESFDSYSVKADDVTNNYIVTLTRNDVEAVRYYQSNSYDHGECSELCSHRCHGCITLSESTRMVTRDYI